MTPNTAVDKVSANGLGFWETLRNLFIAGGALAAIVAILAGLVGYQIAQQSAVVMFPPGTVITIPATKV